MSASIDTRVAGGGGGACGAWVGGGACGPAFHGLISGGFVSETGENHWEKPRGSGVADELGSLKNPDWSLPCMDGRLPDSWRRLYSSSDMPCLTADSASRMSPRVRAEKSTPEDPAASSHGDEAALPGMSHKSLSTSASPEISSSHSRSSSRSRWERSAAPMVPGLGGWPTSRRPSLASSQSLYLCSLSSCFLLRSSRARSFSRRAASAASSGSLSAVWNDESPGKHALVAGQRPTWRNWSREYVAPAPSGFSPTVSLLAGAFSIFRSLDAASFVSTRSAPCGGRCAVAPGMPLAAPLRPFSSRWRWPCAQMSAAPFLGGML
mmetsp:Transcript_9219/g.23281  ORF Transcript_9219/g.23281 Transcript_9219/m.23281 type:complete len:322 (+) Transcript_9219:1626-2591(+)